MVTDHKKLQQFINRKSLSSKQVCWAQKLFKYDFRIDNCHSKANKAVDTLSQYSQYSDEEETTFWAENTKILYWLQFLLVWVLELRVKVLFHLYYILICKTVDLLQLYQFWDNIWSGLAHKCPYSIRIGAMKMRLLKL